MKKRVSVILILMLALALCLSAAAMATVRLLEVEDVGTQTTTEKVYTDGFDEEDGTLKKDSPLYDGVLYDGTATLEGDKTYIVKGETVINGNLTINGSAPKLVLCENATLTVNGSLILNCQMLEIYGSTATSSKSDSGVLFINSADPSAAAVKSTHQVGTTTRTTIFCVGGKLAVQSASGILTENVTLCKPLNAETSIQKYTLDGEIKLPRDWDNLSFNELNGSSLTVEYCKHDHVTYEKASESTHTIHCADCGFVGTARTCGSDGYVGYESVGENGHYKKCPCGNTYDLEEHTKVFVPTNDGKQHFYGCQFCDWTEGSKAEEHKNWDEYGACGDCKFQPILRGADGNLYDNLDEALEKETELTLVSKATGEDYKGIVKQSLVFDTVKPITLYMGGCKLNSSSGPAIEVAGGELIVEGDAVIANIGVSSAVSISGGTVTFSGDLTATGGSGTSSAAPAIEISGGKVIFEGAVNATGGLQGNAGSGNLMNCRPAVYATGGELDFKGALDLNGGLTITGTATLANKLTQGTFRVEYYYKDGEETKKESVSNGRAVSVVGSENYEYVPELVADNHVFKNLDPDSNNKYFTSSYDSLGWDVTIVEHEHTWENSVCSECGKICDHSAGYEGGKCQTCGTACTHGSLTIDDSECRICGQKMLVLNTKGIRGESDYKFTYFANLADAMAAAENGWTVKLRGDIDNGNQYVILTGDNKTVTLDLNGYTVNGGWIFVGIDRNRDNYTSSRLNITGNGSFLTSGNLSVGYTATLDLSGWESGTISTLNPSKSGNNESTLTVGEKAGTINSFQIYSWPTDAGDITYIANTELRGGTYNRNSITMNSPTGADKSIPYSSMLAEGYAFQYVESGEFVDYAAKADYGSGGGNLKNVKVVKCTAHVDKTGAVDSEGTAVGDGKCDYCNTNVADAQAKVVTADNETFYCDLVDAIAKVNAAGGTITMQNNVENVNEMLVIEGIYDVILDLKGKTISGTGSQSTLLADSNYKKLTIRDSSEEQTGLIKCTASGYAVYATGDLIIESGEFECTDNATGYALGVSDAGLIITGGTFNSPVNIKSRYEISGGTFEKLVNIESSSVKTISGGTFASLKIERSKISTLLVEGYIFESTNNGYLDTAASEISNVRVVPCKHESGVNAINECTACGLTMTLKTVHTDGTATYGTDLHTVLTKAESGAVVTLLANVSSDSTAELEIRANITINLNGHTLTYSENSIDVYYANVAINGEGSVSGITVYPNSTLNLSGWRGGTIESVNIRDASSGLTSGKGTIESLYLNKSGGEFKNISLSSGTYNKIWTITTNVKATHKELLADGFVFQAIEDGGYYCSADEFTTLEHVTVVACPHNNITVGENGGTCYICGLSNIVATLKTGITSEEVMAYTDINIAIKEWLANGGTLKLYANYQSESFTSFANAKAMSFTIDLNGFEFNHDVPMTLGGKQLIVNDSREKSNGRFGPLVADSGWLILNNGHLLGLTVDESSEANIQLLGGKVSGVDYPYPIYKLLDNGYALMNGESTEDPTKKPDSTLSYTIKNSQNINVTVESGKTGSVAYSEKNIPLGLTLTTADSNVKYMQFEWYVVLENGTVQRIARSGDVPPNGGVYTYTFNASDVNNEYVDWNGLTVGEYEVLCVVTGKADNKAYEWQTAYGAYELTVTPADLSRAAITISGGNAEDGKGNPRFVYQPEETTEGLVGISLAPTFTVKLGEKTLTLDRDYEVVNGDKGTDAKNYTLTIQGKGNYEGIAAKVWTIYPYELGAVSQPQITKKYDGTSAADANVNGFDALKRYTVDSKNPKNPWFANDLLELNASDFEITNPYFDKPDAGDRTFTYTIELKTNNFVFADGTRKNTIPLSSTSTNGVFITEAAAPANVSAALTVTNDLKKTYTFDLPALPELTSPLEYGEIEYTVVDADIALGSYYTTGAKIENGKLVLPINEVKTEAVGSIGTVKVKVKANNYNAFYIVFTVNAANKVKPQVTTISAADITYGDTLSKSEITGTMLHPDTKEPIRGTFSWVGGNLKPAANDSYPGFWKFVPDNRELYAEVTGEVDVKVKRKTIDETLSVTISDLTYNGNPQKPAVSNVQFLLHPEDVEPVTLIADTDYSVTVESKTNAGQYELTITGEGNYIGSVKKTWMIGQKVVSNPSITVADGVYNNGEGVTPTVVVKDGETVIPESEYTLVYSNNTNAGTGTVEIYNAAEGNYQLGENLGSGFSKNFTISKANQAITADDIIATYGNVGVKVTHTGTVGAVTYASSDTTVVTVDENGVLTILKAGSATVTISAAGDDNHEPAEKEISVNVAKKELNVIISDRTAYVGETLDLSSAVLGKDYRVEGLVGNDEFTLFDKAWLICWDEAGKEVEPDTSKPGTYKLGMKFSPNDSDKYGFNFPFETGTLTIDYAPPETYSITVDESENGTVTASRRSATRGQTVTLTVTPDEGYALSSLTVTDAKGNAAQLTETDGAYSFKMPGSKVTVAAAFEKISTEPRFDDVTPDDWFFDDVEWAADEGLVSGVTDTTFDPNSGCTRAHIVTMLWRAAGCPVVNYLMPFTDVAEELWYTEAIRWAASERIVLGTSETTFTPDRICTRAQVAAMLYRYAAWAEMDTTQGGMAIREFDDYADIPEYALEPMGWAVNTGILVGSDNRLTPNADCTRAQIAAILHRALGK